MSNLTHTFTEANLPDADQFALWSRNLEWKHASLNAKAVLQSLSRMSGSLALYIIPALAIVVIVALVIFTLILVFVGAPILF